ncbi:hypothetical protein VW23_010085 [Devosia insulae DS-56]|uniref:ATPase BadF/BadG/BcrA/BcrD type domain-containing protein n=1 Tax=Devosia insulae DS-56 TaxID=1116389 RepID=A0A1E5XVX1_9HYPH|nr:BadF/BadG/BcrA/BcrD ATPase family protein [Devosia insulae]OEO32737.1 hypothetical protein VW23_010085 [Devosia insulae DS-56]
MSLSVQLGFDIGGTASRWVACDASGAVVARGEVGGASGRMFEPTEHDRLAGVAAAVAREAADRALSVGRVVAGLTGFGPSVAAEVSGILAGAFGLALADVIPFDYMTLAYLDQFAPGEGHLVSAGTGSFGLHVAAGGSPVRVGGRGILIDDAGSGSWIALTALDQVFRGFDRCGSFVDHPVLASELLAAIGGRDWEDVRHFVYGGDRGRIGTLSVAVARAATLGDPAAVEILRAAGGELAQLALALIGRAGERPIAFVGRVIDLHPALREAAVEALAGRTVRFAQADAALAAARLDVAREGFDKLSRKSAKL